MRQRREPGAGAPLDGHPGISDGGETGSVVLVKMRGEMMQGFEHILAEDG